MSEQTKGYDEYMRRLVTREARIAELEEAAREAMVSIDAGDEMDARGMLSRVLTVESEQHTMTDVVEKKVTDLNERLWEALTDNVDADGHIDQDRSIPAMLATLTPGSTWTTEDGVEVMVVPVEATDGMEVAGTEDWLCERATEDRAAACWSAMLSAIRKE